MTKKTHISLTFLGTSHHKDTHPCLLTGFFEMIEKANSDSDSHVACSLFNGLGSINRNNNITNYISSNFFSRLYSQITGFGIDNLVKEAINYIDNLNKDDSNLVLNLQGFSRGADTCVRLANALKADNKYKNIKVNLFLIDPVPGPGLINDPNSYNIPSNVVECRTMYMLNEHKPFFDPQLYIYESQETLVFKNTLPGTHGSGIAMSADNLTRASYYLVADSLLSFNIKHDFLPENASIEIDFKRKGEGFIKKNLNSNTKYRLIDTKDFMFPLDYGWVSYWWIRYVFDQKDVFVLKNNRFYSVDSELETVEEILVNSDEIERISLYFKKLDQSLFPTTDKTDKQSSFISSLIGLKPRARFTVKERFKYFCESMSIFSSLQSRSVVQYLYRHRDVFARRDYERDPELFLDEEHRELFKTLYPAVFSWFFEKNVDNFEKKVVFEQLKTMEPKDFATQFATYFNFEMDKIDFFMPEARGVQKKEIKIFGEKYGLSKFGALSEYDLINKVICDLKYFIMWREFLNYFPSYFGWYNKDSLVSARALLAFIQAKDKGGTVNRDMPLKIEDNDPILTLNREIKPLLKTLGFEFSNEIGCSLGG